MEAWTGSELEAAQLIQKICETEYEKLLRCAASYLMVRNSSLHILNKAEDVVQETFALAWEHKEDVLSSEKPVGWFYKALQYKAKELVKKENRWIKLLLRYQQFYVQPPEAYIHLEFELEGLISKENFDLLHKFYVEGYSYQDLCAETGLTKSALGVRIRRARLKIQEKLKE